MYTVTIIIPVYNQESLILRALESIPRGVHEIIIVNDGSTDNTDMAILNVMQNHRDTNIIYIGLSQNKGVGHALNQGLDLATGDYIELLGSDDYLYPEFAQAMEQLDGTDLVYFNMLNNDGFLYDMSPDNRELHVGSLKFMRRAFLEEHSLRYPEIRVAEDADFMHRLVAFNPTEKYTGILAKHYNYPRSGSLSYYREKKEAEEAGL